MTKKSENLQKEMISIATENEEKGISIHDGHGGNWGSNLAKMFGISNTPKSKITLENMMYTFAKKVLKHHTSGDLYGGVKEYYLNRKGKTTYSTRYSVSYQLFEIDEEYKNNKIDGLYVNYKRNDRNYVAEINFNNVYYVDKIPFVPRNIAFVLKMERLTLALETANGNVSLLSKLLIKEFNQYKEGEHSAENNISCFPAIKGVQLSFNF